MDRRGADRMVRARARMLLFEVGERRMHEAPGASAPVEEQLAWWMYATLSSRQLIVNGFVAAASGARLLRPNEQGVVRWIPRAIARPYVDGITTVQLGLSTASDLAQACVNALPDVGQGLRGIADDLARAAELLEATSKTVHDLSELVPI